MYEKGNGCPVMSAFTGGKALKCNFVRREGLSPDKINIHNHCSSRNDLAAVSALAGPSSRSFSEEKDFRIPAK